MIKNTSTQYGNISKAFHWSMSVIILCLLVVGCIMVQMDDGDTKWQIYALHKSFGLIILTLIPLRILWRLINTTPTLDMVPTWEKHAAKTAHALLYAAMLAMPISGWIMSTASDHIPSFFGLFDVPAPVAASEATATLAGNIHYYVAWTLAGILVLHVGAAIKAHVIDKNTILTRMLPGQQKPTA
jgi:cytochrome b561